MSIIKLKWKKDSDEEEGSESSLSDVYPKVLQAHAKKVAKQVKILSILGVLDLTWEWLNKDLEDEGQ